MNIINVKWSDEAVQALQARFNPPAQTWKLVSDAQGCGCAMNGVPALWAINAPEADDLQADGAVPLWYEKRHEIFFDDQMRISYDAAARSFTLASDGQIYTNRLALVDLRTSASFTNTNEER